METPVTPTHHSDQPHVDNQPSASQNQALPSMGVPASLQPPVEFSSKPAPKSMKKIKPQFLIILSIIAIIAGIGTGFGGYRLQAKNSPTQSGSNAGGELQQVAKGKINDGDVFGVPDEKTFKDKAEGYLEAGGIDGEGSHKLVRPGGISQTVYLTSSVTDLNDFVGMDVKVWGETNKGQKAGWLMDVGRIEVVKTAGSAPSDE
jgi:hypothetical protein